MVFYALFTWLMGAVVLFRWKGRWMGFFLLFLLFFLTAFRGEYICLLYTSDAADE